jgi:hypothetical protein
MKKLACCFVFYFSTSPLYAQSDFAPSSWSFPKFGIGVQVASTTSLLFSWQSAESRKPGQDWPGRTWRVEPSIAFSSSDNEDGSYHSVSESMTIGLGCYMRWCVRPPFNDLFFSMGPRLTVTGTTGTSTQNEFITDSTTGVLTTFSSHFATNLSFLAGPEYDFSKDFSIAGFFSLGATITGRTKYSGYLVPPSSGWSLTTTTGTGIILRFYFM